MKKATIAIGNRANNRAIMTCDEVAEYLRVHVGSVRRWSRSGKLTAFKVGERGDWRYRQHDVMNFLYDGNLLEGREKREVVRMFEA